MSVESATAQPVQTQTIGLTTQNKYQTLQLTKSYLRHIESKECSLKSVVAKVTILAFPLIALLTLFADLLLAVAHCLYGKKEVVVIPTNLTNPNTDPTIPVNNSIPQTILTVEPNTNGNSTPTSPNGSVLVVTNPEETESSASENSAASTASNVSVDPTVPENPLAIVINLGTTVQPILNLPLPPAPANGEPQAPVSGSPEHASAATSSNSSTDIAIHASPPAIINNPLTSLIPIVHSNNQADTSRPESPQAIMHWTSLTSMVEPINSSNNPDILNGRGETIGNNITPPQTPLTRMSSSSSSSLGNSQIIDPTPVNQHDRDGNTVGQNEAPRPLPPEVSGSSSVIEPGPSSQVSIERGATTGTTPKQPKKSTFDQLRSPEGREEIKQQMLKFIGHKSSENPKPNWKTKALDK